MENWSKKLAKSIMERTPRLYEEKWYKGKWSYDYGVVLKGFQLLWERTQEKIYFDFIKDNIDYFVQEACKKMERSVATALKNTISTM